jgi:lambda repressor-like predicted transcriptional regulator
LGIGNINNTEGSVYTSYNFIDKDPVIDQLRTAIQDSGMSWSEISHNSGVSVSCLRNWFHGETRKPQNATIEAVLRAIGKSRVIVDKVVPMPKPSRREQRKGAEIIPLRKRFNKGRVA